MASKIQDIAKMAGVSVATVSLALNDKKGVNKETRRRVMEIAHQMNYTPNAMAKGLSGKKTNNIAVFMSGPQYDYFNSPFYFETLKYFAKNLSNSPYQMVLTLTTVAEELSCLRQLVSKRGIDAIVFLGLRMPVEEAASIAGDLPCVYINRHLTDFHTISADYDKGAYQVTKHLLELGHRDIAMFGYIPKLASTEMRIEGYKQALEEFGVEFKPENLVHAEYFQESGYFAMRKLIQSGVKLPTAIIGGNDLIAIGIMEALFDVGMRIPEDISLAGIDNLPNSHLLKVPLTTVQIRHDIIGEKAAQVIVGLLEGKVEEETNVTVDVQLVIRKSTGKPV
ncbi:MAG: LacI family DNA-binding transcriptional regulator [Candidatus Pristimantibacillus sp.]